MKKHVYSMISDIKICWADLTEWEQEFIEDIEERLDGRENPARHLTEQQQEKLEEIWYERT